MKKCDFRFRRATSLDVEAIYNVMQTAYESLTDKTWYLCDDKDYVQEHIEDKGFAVVACDREDMIVGCLVLRFPGESEDNLGRDIGLDKEIYAKVVHMESAAVLPQWQGNQLQYRLLMYAEELIDRGKYQYLLATVSPENQPSLRSLQKAGYREIVRKEKYEGLKRCIMMKEV